MHINPDAKPKFKHDCERCQFLGANEVGEDVYFCKSFDSTIVIRYSDEPSENRSIPVWLLLQCYGEKFKKKAKPAFLCPDCGEDYEPLCHCIKTA